MIVLVDEPLAENQEEIAAGRNRPAKSALQIDLVARVVVLDEVVPAHVRGELDFEAGSGNVNGEAGAAASERRLFVAECRGGSPIEAPVLRVAVAAREEQVTRGPPLDSGDHADPVARVVAAAEDLEPSREGPRLRGLDDQPAGRPRVLPLLEYHVVEDVSVVLLALHLELYVAGDLIADEGLDRHEVLAEEDLGHPTGIIAIGQDDPEEAVVDRLDLGLGTPADSEAPPIALDVSSP